MGYYQHDHLGTPIQAVDKAGQVIWAADYHAFEQATLITPKATAEAPTITSNLRLPGQYWDGESGLHYNWHRYYDPEVGRYITRDPIGLGGGINTYGYVGASPIYSIDSWGLEAIKTRPTPGLPNPSLEAQHRLAKQFQD
ncbi:RHS repeat-associated core domain-containing protein [Chitiniphilus shinanonensis]|uniref:RHS repeat-associated core domain-containing protein n=1 Tax=Chitiniphilus shinanonensis TaxID=553088 RepID=UPI00306081C6